MAPTSWSRGSPSRTVRERQSRPGRSSHWASLRVQLHEAGRSMGVNDLWIAAIALANGLAVHTQDAGFDVLSELGALQVFRV